MISEQQTRGFNGATGLAATNCRESDCNPSPFGAWRASVLRTSVRIDDTTAIRAGAIERGPLVSVVIPAKNAALTIDACLTALANFVPQGALEVIVVDNGSTDHTVEIALRHGVRVLRTPSGFVSHVRNEGAREARAALVAFVDADCTVLPGWYDAVVTLLSETTVGVAGCRHEIPVSATWCQQVWHDAQLRREQTTSGVPYVPAGNFAMRRELFLSVGGFDEKLESAKIPTCAFASPALDSASSRLRRCGIFTLENRRPWWTNVSTRTLAWRGARFTYNNGRVAPVTVATVMFTGMLVAGTVALVILPFGGPIAEAAAFPLAFLMPLMLALRYESSTRPWQCFKLWLVYSAYFLGRAAALPVVLKRS